MTIDRRTALTLLGASLAAPALAQGADDPFEGGIGGTGIVGTLTGLGSLRVNGLRVGFAPGLRVRTAFGAVAPGALAPGMAVSALAERGRDGRLSTRAVSIDWPLVGRAMDVSARGFRVHGARVRLEPGAVGRAREGERVAVSGAWDGPVLVASRVEPAPTSTDLVSGTGGAGLVGGAPVDRGVPAGAFVEAVGRGTPEGLRVERVRVGRPVFGAGLRQLAVEGYLEPVATAPGFRLAGLGHAFSPDLALAPLAGRRAVYAGPYDGRFRAAAGYVVPEGVAARRRALAEGIGAGFAGPVVRVRG